MKTYSKHYIIEGGPVLEAAVKHRTDHITAMNAIAAYVRSVDGSTGYLMGFNSLLSIRFKGRRPEGFKTPNKNGGCQPYKKSDYNKQFDDLPKTPSTKLVSELLGCPCELRYEHDSGKGVRRIGNMFNPIQVCWYAEHGPLLLITPDVPKHIELLKIYDPSAVLTNKEDEWLIDEKHFREILIEEWDFMAAKHKASKTA